MQAERPFQFTLRQLLAATTYIALTLGLGKWTGSLVIVAQLLLVFIGWIMWRVSARSFRCDHHFADWYGRADLRRDRCCVLRPARVLD